MAFAGLAALSGCDRAPPPNLDEQIRTYILEHPQVVADALTRLQQQKEMQAANAAKTAISMNRDLVERDPRDFVANPNGKITVVEFFDYRCGYCKLSAPKVKEIIEKNPDVRVVFKELPVFGGVSDTAAAVALSAPARAKALKLHEAFMGEKALEERSIDKHLLALGIDPAAARASAKSPEVLQHIQDNRALARALGVQGTPAFLVNDQLIAGADVAALERAIASARSGPPAGLGGAAAGR